MDYNSQENRGLADFLINWCGVHEVVSWSMVLTASAYVVCTFVFFMLHIGGTYLIGLIVAWVISGLIFVALAIYAVFICKKEREEKRKRMTTDGEEIEANYSRVEEDVNDSEI